MDKDKLLKISIVIAAYNEETIIGASLQKIIDLMKSQHHYEWELICVDDGSKDNSHKIMKEFCPSDDRIKVMRHFRNFGQGRALRTGFEQCSGDFIVTMDADLSYGPEYIILLSKALEENHVEISLASPYAKGGSVRNVPFYRHFLSRYGNKYLAKMSHYNISTSTCVVRGYRTEPLKALFLTSDGMELQLEILMKAHMMGYRVTEVPAVLEWADQKASESDFKRVSKMRILRTIRLYLLMGWLEKPAYIFFIFSALMLLTGSYMSVVLLYRIAENLVKYLSLGFVMAVSSALREAFTSYTYSFIISGGLIIFGFQMLAFALMTLQSKYYFEELFKIGVRPVNIETTRKFKD